MPENIELSAERRRAALDVLPRDRLGQIAERFELEVVNHRVAANHADAARTGDTERQGQPEADGGHRSQGDRARWSMASVAALALALHPDGNLMRERFEGYRWAAAADMLRGSFSRSDSKNAQHTDEDESP